MSLEITREDFTEADHALFAERLQQSLDVLARLLDQEDFGTGPATLGAELELALVDPAGRPLPVNRSVLAAAVDPRVSLEIDRFNLEVNTRPVPLGGRAFTALAGRAGGLARRHRPGGGGVRRAVHHHRHPADAHPGRPQAGHAHGLGALPRTLGGHPPPAAPTLRIRIAGDDPLDVGCADVTFEGANTSLQIHLRVPPRDFAATYNAAQIATAPVLAASGNSPLFLGHRLWEETRVALFRQAVDERIAAAEEDWRPARVSFGHGWVREGALELFAESVALHPPLLPLVGSEDPAAYVRGRGVPALEELRLHHGTVWRWNRAVFDPSAGGHLRIELRALPAGPSVVDMAANAAFLVGLTLGLAPDARRLVTALTFGQARRNFYEAARLGLDAELLWPAHAPPSPRPVRAATLVLELLPVAREALLASGVDAAEVDTLLDVIAVRVARGRTGARWQRRHARAPRAEDGARDGRCESSSGATSRRCRRVVRCTSGRWTPDGSAARAAHL